MNDKVQYKDIKPIKKELFKLVDDMPKEYCNAIDDCINIIDNVPTADVVPKSEYEMLKKSFDTYYVSDHLEQVKAKVASEIFAEIEKIDEDTASFQEFYSRIMKLKKKYTEGAQDV